MNTVQLSTILPRVLAGSLAVFSWVVAFPVCANTLTYVPPALGGVTYASTPLEFGGTAAGDMSRNMGGYSVYEGTASSSPFWVYCLDPLTYFSGGANYSVTGLWNFLTSGGGYGIEFGSSTYTQYASGSNPFHAQTTGAASTSLSSSVLSKLTDLYHHAYKDGISSSVKNAAFQYAIWEIEGDSAYTAGNGVSTYDTMSGGLKFQASGSAIQVQAQAYLSALNSTAANRWDNVNGANLSASTTYAFTVYQWTSGTSPTTQNLLRVVDRPGGDITKVPEPATGVLAAMGALALIATSRRRSKANASA